MARKSKATGRGQTGLRFESILVNAEQSLRLELDKARLESDHGLTIGETAEIAVRHFLRGVLPAGYAVGQGHVYDAYGDRSKQTDVIIANPEHPLTFPIDRAGTYVVDGVAAAGEVKATLTTQKLQDCLTKGAQFKQLRMTLNPGDFAGSVGHPLLLKELGLVPPYFVIAFAHKGDLKTLLKQLEAAALVPPPAGKSEGENDWANTPQPPLDAVCVLGQGVFLYVRPDNPLGLIARESVDGPDYTGWLFMGTDAPLAWTLTWLHATMPRVLRGSSVFGPYLIPNARNLQYMADRGYITIADSQPDSTAHQEERPV